MAYRNEIRHSNARIPGTSYEWNRLDPHLSQVVETRVVDAGIATLNDAINRAESEFPIRVGAAPHLPLRRVQIRMLDNDQAILIGYYEQGGNEGNFSTKSSFATSKRQATTYRWPGNTPDTVKVHQTGENQGYLKPRNIIVPQLHITWTSAFTYQDTKPDIALFRNGTLNGGTVRIDGFAFGPETIRYDGIDLVHQERAGSDRWYWKYAYTWDAAQWRDGDLKRETKPGTPVAVRPNTNLALA